MATCKWCGREYTKQHNREMYCSQEHRIEARREQNRKHFNKYYHKYKYDMTEKQRYGLGSGFLSQNRNLNFNEEYISIKKEIFRLKIR